MSSFIDTLKSIDNAVLLFINGMHSPFFDGFMAVVSNRLIWIPLYILLAYLIIRKYGKSSWLVIIFGILAVALSDQLASNLLKNIVMRYRPSHNLTLAPQLHFVNGYMGGLYGFASSHAANTFALATFIMLIMPQQPKLAIALFCWALLVCYSRMYLGVHYPSDIAGGMIVGCLSAWICCKLWRLVSKRLALG
jgi:undecaprenyl-diphosphatase